VYLVTAVAAASTDAISAPAHLSQPLPGMRPHLGSLANLLQFSKSRKDPSPAPTQPSHSCPHALLLPPHS
jgi:hypothetical protein